MKKSFAFAALMSVAQAGMAVEAGEPDSLKLEELNEVVVKAVKAPANAPFAVSKIGRQELEAFGRTGQELPFLLARTPGVLAWSENGVGTGTSYLRMRGAGDSRINVTMDGVALNSPEDQCVFWANMNSYASLLSNVQIQRGVGTSTNGDGAFGGTVALTTKFPDLQPSLDLNIGYGSYNTMNFGGRFSTGLLWNHLIVDGAYHETRTDGFMHGTSGRSGSYYGGLTFINNQGTLKLSYKNIGNFEKTGQAWNGVDTGDLLDGNYGMTTGLNSYKDFYNAGMGKYNTLYEQLVDGYDPSKGTQRYQLADGTLWDKTTDNFWQNHNLLNLTWKIDDEWTTTATAHYTRGHGYYDEFRPNNKLSKFGLDPFTQADGSTLKKTDFVRQKGLTQDTYGLVWNVNWQRDRWDVMGGLALQYFTGNHYGYLTYVANSELRDALLAGGKYQYYDSDAQKGDNSFFIKAKYNFTEALSAFADLQYRYVTYRTDGYNDKFLTNPDGSMGKHWLDINQTYHFANPKVGLSYARNGHAAYASYAMANREPERNNFTDNGSYPAPKAERLHDFELGYSYTTHRWHAGLGLYAMLYDNQFVQTGLVSDIGENLTTNIKDSRRLGIEAQAGVNITPWLSLEANAAISRNEILDFDEVVEDWDNGSQTIHYDHSTLAFSPTAIVNAFADVHTHGFQATWHTGYVSKMFLDNTACDQRALDAFTRTDVALSYDLKCWRKGLKHAIFGLNFNNIFNAHYAQSGWVYSAIYASGGHTNDNRYREIGYIPAAGFHMMGTITLKF
ncbi:MAG: TonB-dependent receptor plug domain-containing protein [Bacteroidaceae bacterium]|nr:TonB-dependent receptor plug domain-containing protein [Bacteroidaceae bacterium]